jgi:AcrR family transcriptional regulator
MKTLGPQLKSNAKSKRRVAAPEPTRDKLLDVAGRIFAERGYRATTIREICVAARANVAAVNYHFGDKLGLYTEVVQQAARLAEFHAAQTVIDQDAPAEEVLRAVIRARLRSLFQGNRPEWHFRIIGGLSGSPAESEAARLCALSVMGQIMVYALASPLVAGIWPELKMTSEQVDRIADHIANFSLCYIQSIRSANSAHSGNGTIRAATRARK